MRQLPALRRFFPTAIGRGWMGTLVLVAIASVSTRASEPDRSPRRVFPARDLVAYLEYEGLDAHARAWEATAAHDILVKSRAGAMLTELFKQSFDQSVKVWTGGDIDASSVLTFVDLIAHRGFAGGVYVSSQFDLGAVVTLKGFGRTDLARRLDPLRKSSEDAGALSGPHPIRGRHVFQFADPSEDPDAIDPLHVDAPPGTSTTSPRPPIASFWMEGDDLIVVLGDCDSRPARADAAAIADADPAHPAIVLDAIEGKVPDVTTHPGFASAVAEGKDLKGFEPNGLYFIELKPELGGACVVLEAVDVAAEEVAAEIASWLTERNFVAADHDAKPAPSRSQQEAGTGPTPRKDEDLARASTRGPEKTPAPEAAAPGRDGDIASKPAPKTPDHEVDDVSLTEFEQVSRYIARQLGLDGVKRIVGRWGFQGKALLSDMRIEAPAPRRGVPAWFEQPGFRKDRLPAIPPGAGTFVLASFDPEGVYRKIAETMKAIEPEIFETYAGLEKILQESVGLRIREDLLRHVGPTWAMIDVPGRSGHGKPGEPTGGKHLAFVAGIDEADAFEKVADTLARRIDGGLRAYLESVRQAAPKGLAIGQFGLKRLPAPDRGYRLDLPSFTANSGPIAVDPSAKRMMSLFVLIGRSSVVAAFELDVAREVLAAQGSPARHWKPDGELAEAFAGLPDNLTFLSITDPEACALPSWIAGLPRTIRYFMTGSTFTEDLENRTGWVVLNLMGLPRPGQFWPVIAPSQSPRADDLRRAMFASVLASSVDDRGYRIIHRQPFPFAGLASELDFHQRWSIDYRKGLALPGATYKFSLELSRLGTRY